jgi:hypothetical protein
MKKEKLLCSLFINLAFTFIAVSIVVAGTITGTLSYSGLQTGATYVAVFTSPINCSPPNPQTPFEYVELSSLGAYTISDLPDGTYYVVSIIETDNTEPTDPWVVYGGCGTATPLFISGNSDISGINITLIDGTAANPNPFYEKYRPQVNSRHHSDNFTPGYYASLEVSDNDKNADSVFVSGPGITGDMELGYDNDWKRWLSSPNPYVGSSVPSTPQTYSFTINDATGTYTYDRTITGYVEDFATNLTPAGNVEGPIVFSWTGIANADEYGVRLDSGEGMGWKNYDIPGITTSIPYDGPPLVQGQVYHWHVHAAIITDDGYNLSFSQEASFTFGVLQPPSGSFLASVPVGASFDFSTGTVDPSGLSGDFRYGSHNIVGLTAAPSGVSWWIGTGVSSFADWINDPS